jgi:hypothetical protein
MKKILDIFKKKEKETDYEIVKSRSGLPMFVIPLPDGINMDTKEEPKDFFTKGEEK